MSVFSNELLPHFKAMGNLGSFFAFKGELIYDIVFLLDGSPPLPQDFYQLFCGILTLPILFSFFCKLYVQIHKRNSGYFLKKEKNVC